MTASAIPSLMVIGAICITIGYVFGWLIASMRGNSHEKDMAAKAESAPEGKTSLLKIARDAEKGGLVVTLLQKEAGAADQLSVDERKQVTALLQETAAWIGGPIVPTTPVAGVAAPSVGVAVVPAPVAEPVRTNVLGGVTAAIADVINPAAAKKEGPKSIVMQIDEILQDKLVGTALESQKIYLAEDARNGVLVRVGNETYAGIGAVPEGEIKNLLKICVQEWERKQEVAKRHSA